MENFSERVQQMKDTQAEEERKQREAATEEAPASEHEPLPEGKELAKLEREVLERFLSLQTLSRAATDAVRAATDFVRLKGDKLSEASRDMYEKLLVDADMAKQEYAEVGDELEKIRKQIAKAKKRP